MEAQMLPPLLSYFFILYNNYYNTAVLTRMRIEILRALLSMGTALIKQNIVDKNELKTPMPSLTKALFLLH